MTSVIANSKHHIHLESMGWRTVYVAHNVATLVPPGR